VPPIVHEVLRSPGQPLDMETRRFMEPRLGHDFSQVRVHTDARAVESARTVNALAYTVGHNIVFGAGQYAPGTSVGNGLMAHELTHVTQQSRWSEVSQANLGISASVDEGEFEAERAAKSIMLGKRVLPALQAMDNSTRTVQRACISGSECAGPILGAPGQFVAKSEAQQAPAQAARAQQAAQAEAARSKAVQPALTPADTAKQEQARQEVERFKTTGQGAHATQLERFAKAKGLNLATSQGIFIDLDISPEYGAVTRPCAAFLSFVPPYAGPANGKCIFVPAHLEAEAKLFYDNSTAPTIGKLSRELWPVTTFQILSHELQHINFDNATHPNQAGLGCSRTTEMYRERDTVWTVQIYLSELSAIISEFPPIFRAIPHGAGANNPISAYLQTWFDYKVDTAKENISGILKAMSCRCGCGEVDNYIKDTFNFTSGSWSHGERVAFNTIMSRRSGIKWPLQGDPICMDKCETDFNACVNGRHGFDVIGVPNCLAARSFCFSNCF
jgi:hypothetical protein